MFDIIWVLDEHYVTFGFMGISSMLNTGATADSDNNFCVAGGNISEEADKIVGDTSSSASVPTA